MKALVMLVGSVLLPLVAQADITNIGPLFPGNFIFTSTMPTGVPAINAAGSVAGQSYTVFADGTEQLGEFRYSHGSLSNLGLGAIFAITDDGAVWGGFLACAASTAGIQRLDKNGSCTGLPSTDLNGAIGVSVSPSGQWVLGQPNGAGFGRPMLAWQRTASNSYVFYNLGPAADPYAGDARFGLASTFAATNINESGEFAVTVSNNYVDVNNNYVSVFHAYLYRIDGGVAVVAVDLGEGIIAEAINDAGDVAGLGGALVAGNPQQPFIYKSGNVQTWSLASIPVIPGFLPTIVGLNNAGDVAFWVPTTDTNTHSFLRQHTGRFVDVGSIFPAGHNFEMIAVGLNSRGQITGYGTDFSSPLVDAYYTWVFSGNNKP